MQLLLDHVDAVKEHVKELAEEIEIEKINSTEAADELSLWEERVKSCKETQNVLSQEKVSVPHIYLGFNRNISCLFSAHFLIRRKILNILIISGPRSRIGHASKRHSPNAK